MTDSDSLTELRIEEGLQSLDATRIATLYRRAPLQRPVSDPRRLWQMFERSSLVLSAWMGDRLVGLARTLSDGVDFCYVCDLAVEPDLQRLGIGRHLMDEVYRRNRGAEVMVRGARLPGSYLQRMGFEPVTNAWRKQL